MKPIFKTETYTVISALDLPKEVKDSLWCPANDTYQEYWYSEGDPLTEFIIENGGSPHSKISNSLVLVMNESDLTILLECKVGSQAYGTSTPTSDTDYKGFCIAPLRYYFGFLQKFEQLESHDPDRVIYNVIKFFDLAANGNPNILDVLFCDESNIISVNDLGQHVLENRDLFLSKKVRHTFGGYAHAQLKRLQSHRGWLFNPIETEPTRSNYGLSDYRTWSATDMGVLEKQESKNPEAFAESMARETLDLFYREREYNSARRKWEQFQNWKTNRNPARSELEAKFGLDTKHAAHLVRLLRMGVEILSGKGVLVKRPDAEELLAIRNGAWTYEQLVEYAESLDSQLDTLYKTTTLPHEPPREKLDSLLRSILCDHFRHDIMAHVST